MSKVRKRIGLPALYPTRPSFEWWNAFRFKLYSRNSFLLTESLGSSYSIPMRHCIKKEQSQLIWVALLRYWKRYPLMSPDALTTCQWRWGKMWEWIALQGFWTFSSHTEGASGSCLNLSGWMIVILKWSTVFDSSKTLRFADWCLKSATFKRRKLRISSSKTLFSYT